MTLTSYEIHIILALLSERIKGKEEFVPMPYVRLYHKLSEEQMKVEESVK